MAYEGSEGWPAKISARVDKEHDYDATVTAAEQAGLTDTSKMWLTRWFGGHVATQEIWNAVAAVPGVENVQRPRQLVME